MCSKIADEHRVAMDAVEAAHAVDRYMDDGFLESAVKSVAYEAAIEGASAKSAIETVATEPAFKAVSSETSAATESVSTDPSVTTETAITSEVATSKSAIATETAPTASIELGSFLNFEAATAMLCDSWKGDNRGRKSHDGAKFGQIA